MNSLSSCRNEVRVRIICLLLYGSDKRVLELFHFCGFYLSIALLIIVGSVLLSNFERD